MRPVESAAPQAHLQSHLGHTVSSCRWRSVTLPGHQSSLGSSRVHEALGAWQAFGVEFVLSFLLASTVFASRDTSHLGGGDALVVGFAYLACTLAGVSAALYVYCSSSLTPRRCQI
ncbi:hypothetical protein HPB48_011755 [Haemaphysalis longicornis]|uniref:Uncharacterized protein n=1 Tax=Haemaphysalis longicornis TaxID=44386 RepID=A0A9J6H3L0_HAELO|nr:hypothetical protein HPB48_011755 [Haemaphysalis longicornis]